MTVYRVNTMTLTDFTHYLRDHGIPCSLEFCRQVLRHQSIESMLCEPGPDGYHFITQSDGTNTCKSPMEMLPATMDNDLKAVDTAIRNYWNLGGTNHD